MIKKLNRQKSIAVIGILILLAGMLFYFFVYNPANEENLYVACMFKEATGLDCPGCGGQRALHQLLHFHFLEALGLNAYFVLFIPYFLLLIFYEVRRFFFHIPKPNNFWTSNKMLWIFLIGLFLFGIIRNIPVYPFTLLSTTG